MKNKVGACIALLGLTACADDARMDTRDELIRSISIVLPEVPTFPQEGTRTQHELTATGIKTLWTQGDTLGIYPVGGDQVAFPISSDYGQSTAYFDGGSWALRSTYLYAAYYPFSMMNYLREEDQLPVCYLGQQQTGNNSLDHLGAYDFLASVVQSPDEDGHIEFDLQHLGCFMRLKFTMPQPGTFTRMVISSDLTEFVTDAMLDLTATPSPTLTPTATSPNYELLLADVSTQEAGETVTLYCMTAPTDLSDSELTITITDTDANAYTFSTHGKLMSPGGAYQYKTSWVE